MASDPEARTYTVEHHLGARVTFDSIEHAAAMTGWEGWTATAIDDLDPGMHLDAVATKADLVTFADAMEIDTSSVTPRTTRAEIEQLITARPHDEED